MGEAAQPLVLVTGANGFVGRALCQQLVQQGYRVRAAVRTAGLKPAGVAEELVMGDICAVTDWSGALRDAELVVHLAARVHMLRDDRDRSDPYLATNTRATQRLADAAARAGIRRLVYLSSIKVNGEQTAARSYTPFDEPQPQDAYARSKQLAEQYLMGLNAARALSVAIVRPPLVYGPCVRANFLRLLRWVDRGTPLPLAAVANRRSLVSVWNLCDLLVHLLEHPHASSHPWLVSDGEDLSTPQLIRRIAHAMERRALLLPVPSALLQWSAALLGRKQEIARLCGSLTVDIGATRRELQWSPPVSVDDGLARTVRWYLSTEHANGT